jgi:hypothetical protein
MNVYSVTDFKAQRAANTVVQAEDHEAAARKYLRAAKIAGAELLRTHLGGDMHVAQVSRRDGMLFPGEGRWYVVRIPEQARLDA